MHGHRVAHCAPGGVGCPHLLGLWQVPTCPWGLAFSSVDGDGAHACLLWWEPEVLNLQGPCLSTGSS